MRHARSILACLLLVACSRKPPAPAAASSAVNPKGPVDQGYVDRLMAATAFAPSACEAPVALKGIGALGSQSASPGGVMVAVDSSGSMAARSPGGATRMAEAARAVSDFAARLPPDARVGLAAFGQAGSNRAGDKAASCRAPVEVLAPMADHAAAPLAAAAARLRPAGWTPLAAAIRTTAAQVGAQGVVYVISDGVETCGGDPVQAARGAKARAVVVNVIGFGVTAPAETAALQAVAAAGGGRYLGVAPGALAETLNREASAAFDANATTTGDAMMARQTCFYDRMRRQSDETGRRINGDQGAQRISTATAAAAFRAQNARYAAASARLSAELSALGQARERQNASVLQQVNGQSALAPKR